MNYNIYYLFIDLIINILVCIDIVGNYASVTNNVENRIKLASLNSRNNAFYHRHITDEIYTTE